MSKRPRRKLPSVDVSVLEQPLNLGGSDAVVLAKALRNGTSEIQHVLVNECSVILECRVCRALFRSMANLLSHKRHYCRVSHSDRAAASSRNADVTQIVSVSSAVAVSTLAGESHRTPVENSAASRLEDLSQIATKKQQDPALPALAAKRRGDSSLLAVTAGDRGDHLAKQALMALMPTATSAKSEAATSVSSAAVVLGVKASTTAPQQHLPANSSLSRLDSEMALDGADSSKSNEDEHCTDICMRTWQCFTCHLALDNSYRMRRHLVYDHGTEVRYHLCPRCGLEREYFFEIMRHLHTAHGLAAKQLADLREDIKDRVRYRPRQHTPPASGIQ